MLQMKTRHAKARVNAAMAIQSDNAQYIVYAGCVAVSSSDDIGFAIGIAERYESRGYDCVQVQDRVRKQVIWEGGE